MPGRQPAECLSNSVNHWASCNWTNAVEYRLPANTSFVFQHARFGENPAIRMRISVIIQMNPCAFRFPSIHGSWGRLHTESLANTPFPMIEPWRLNIGCGWKKVLPSTFIGPMAPTVRLNASCAKYCPSIIPMRCSRPVIRRKCILVQAPNSTCIRSGLRDRSMKNGP